MTEEQIKLARRLVTSPGWRWMPGMKVDGGFRVVESLVPFTFPVDLPDLADAATIGCLLALVREAWESPKANVSWVTDDKCMVVFDTGRAQRFLLGDTEAEALVAALEAAP